MKGVSLMETSTIVPIVLALLIFFGSVVSAMNTVQRKSEQIDLVLSLVQIVDKMTEAGVLTKDRFSEVVDVLSETMPVQFYVCVTRYGDDRYNRCQLHGAKNDKYDTRDPKNILNKIHGDYLSAAFPVTFQVEKDGVPFNEVNRLLVIVWQGA